MAPKVLDVGSAEVRCTVAPDALQLGILQVRSACPSEQDVPVPQNQALNGSAFDLGLGPSFPQFVGLKHHV